MGFRRARPGCAGWQRTSYTCKMTVGPPPITFWSTDCWITVEANDHWEGSRDSARAAAPVPLSRAWRTATPWLNSIPPKISSPRIISINKASTEAWPCRKELRPDFSVDIVEFGLQGNEDLP